MLLRKVFLVVILTILLGFFNINSVYAQDEQAYLSDRLQQLVKLSAPSHQGLDYFILPTELEQIPADPQNPLTPEKIYLGKLLFHETALSINPINPKHWQQSSCASCHFAQAGFRSNLAQGLGVGGLGWNKSRHRDPDTKSVEIDKQNILVPSVLNSAYQQIMFWDGKAGMNGLKTQVLLQKLDINRFGVDGLEAQAIDGLTTHRMGTAAIATIPAYQELFAQAFPDRPYVSAELEDLENAGKAIAAYERTLLANQSPWQKWLRGDRSAMSSVELKGAIAFFSSSCIQCHTGPNLASNNFAAVGFGDHPQDWTGLNLGRGAVTKQAEDDFKFKVPQLYNLADSHPHGHGASFNTIKEVVEYFNQAQPQKLEALYAGNLSVWFRPLHLTPEEIDNLTAFLTTGLRDPNLIRYVPESIPSQLCFPNNDPESQRQLCENNLSE